jgi:hypothetical protein
MADIIRLTPVPTRVLPGDVIQNLWSIVDVTDYKVIDLELEVVGWESPLASPSLSMVINTSFQRESFEGSWPLAFANLTPTVPVVKVHIPNQRDRYLMWECSTISNASSALIWITGVARAWGE